LSKSQVIIFAKNPEVGKVKTRLAAGVGDESALKIYKFLLAHTFRVVASTGLDVHVFFSDFIDETLTGFHPDFQSHVQKGKGLGERLYHAFEKVSRSGNNCIVIGSDCFQLTKVHLLACVDGLEVGDMVIGPSHDGGYYLLGLNEFHPTLFQDIHWSTEKMFQQTVDKSQQLGLRVIQLETLHDVDDIESLQKSGLTLDVD